MRSLEFLDLSANNFFGQIPNSIGSLQSLKELNLLNNQFIGSLPKSFMNCINLKVLDVRHNLFTASYLSLQVLDLSSNALSGGVPSAIGNFSRLRILNISKNSLGGFIPPSVGDLNTTHILDLSYNQLNGSILAEIRGAVSLQELRLDSNFLYGAIPANIGKLSMENMDVFENEERLEATITNRCKIGMVDELEVKSTLIPTEVELEEVYWKELTPCVEEEDTDSQDSKRNETEHDGKLSHSFHQHCPRVSQPPPVCHDHNIADVVRMEMEKLKGRLLWVISKRLDQMEYKIDSLVELVVVGRYHSTTKAYDSPICNTTNVYVAQSEVERKEEAGPDDVMDELEKERILEDKAGEELVGEEKAGEDENVSDETEFVEK
ncbi:putative LRR receptor-like serine/threonine-protein kinase IRK [Forsythia ovata]|uniref:LRR receptor-like serine/threonine-protein kinase IRK n=1 Tax=Forsythia ovata TaxID=205694 RepID=A0ABD1UWG7_9LAMI